ncbi:hypothetical protein GEMRC1_013374 [Eukaryota sp. GEM-RC1]
MLAFKNLISSVTNPADIQINLSNEDSRKKLPLSKSKPNELAILYESSDPVTGEISVDPLPGKRIEHVGIKVQLIGQIELESERNRPFEFTSAEQELEGPGTLSSSITYPFDFSTVEKPHETYSGKTVKLRYFIRVTVARSIAPNIMAEKDIVVHSYSILPSVNQPIRCEVGIEDKLHIEFEYSKSKYHLSDFVTGKVYFLLVRIKIKYMEIAIIRRETAGNGVSTGEGETIAKFEVMDGAAIRGETVPIRLQLGGYDLSPTMSNVQNKFSVRYYLNLVLIDEDREQRAVLNYHRWQFKEAIDTINPLLSSFDSLSESLRQSVGLLLVECNLALGKLEQVASSLDLVSSLFTIDENASVSDLTIPYAFPLSSSTLSFLHSLFRCQKVLSFPSSAPHLPALLKSVKKSSKQFYQEFPRLLFLGQSRGSIRKSIRLLHSCPWQSLPIAKHLSNYTDAVAFNNLASCYHSFGKPNLAVSYISRALASLSQGPSLAPASVIDACKVSITIMLHALPSQTNVLPLLPLPFSTISALHSVLTSSDQNKLDPSF